jgi:hypothetical protein
MLKQIYFGILPWHKLNIELMKWTGGLENATWINMEFIIIGVYEFCIEGKVVSTSYIQDKL